MKTAILILAAGKSSRMKTAKQLLPVGNQTLLGLCIENALKTNIDDIFCVLGANARKIESGIRKYNINVIKNLNYEQGLGSSISFGVSYLENLNFDAILILLGDQPKVSSDYLNELISNILQDSMFIYASQYSEKIGVPAIFPKRYFIDLLLLAGEKGAGDFLNNELVAVKSINFAVDLMDIDTPEDYKNFIQ